MSCVGWERRRKNSASRSSRASPAAEVLYDDNGAVRGVATGNMGVGKDGQPTANFQPGVELLGKYTLFAEGRARPPGQAGDRPIHGLDEGRDPQTWGIGIKEVWEIDPAKHVPGLVVHSAGWPLDHATYGGGFLYHMAGQPGLGGPGGRPGLRQSPPRAVPGIPALQDAPAALRLPRRRQAHRLRRAGDQRQRPAVAAQARLPRRGAHRLRRGLPERAADQGFARSDQDRDAGRRRGVRRSGRRSRARRARRVSGRLRLVVALRRAPPGTELQAAARPRARRPAPCCGVSTSCCSAARRPGRCIARHPTTPSCGRPPSACRSSIRNPTACSPSTSCRRCTSPTPTTKRTSRRT